MALIEVVRDRPPARACCRADNCKRPIEWVLTKPNGRKMPVDAPLVIAQITQDLDGTEHVWIDSSTVHWTTCPEAKSFSKRQRGGR